MADSSARVASMSAVKLALLARQMRSQVEDVLRAEPIAIIGMGCRVPGANSLEDFWQLLSNGVDAVREVPADRWDIDSLYDPDFNVLGKVSSRWGGFLDQIDGFDPTFFGITPREAQRMDPQQRLFLEVAYEALEDAGVTNATLNDSLTGVFVASYHDDYALMQFSHPDLIDGRTLTGTLQSIVSNRLSFLLNTHGPSLTLDTACSSSLVAIHLACQHLRNRECDLAVAGGVNIMFGAELNISMSRVGFLSPTGRCRTFDAAADGFVRGEGCGIVVLKRLSDAIADGDHIHAVIRGSAVNQDGRSNVLTAPNGIAQRQLVRTALENAGVSPDQITYVEAHGTGTALGDPIEVEALADVLGKGEHPCVLSSVKTNIGHLEAAAGVVGLIKSVLCLGNESIPGNVHFTSLNPHISLDGTRMVITADSQPWRKGELPRFAGVSSFGVGGTNAHVILEEAPQLPSQPQVDTGKAYLLPISAHSPDALRARAADLRDLLNSEAAFLLNDLNYTLSAHRTHHDYRLSVVGASREEMAEQLDSFVRDELRPGVFAGYAADDSGKLTFVFSGQGPQWWAMGRELYESEPVFKQTIEQISNLLSTYTTWSLVDELLADEQTSRLDQTEIAQPAIFALQVGLAALWQSWGIVPDAVVGHSVGEIAAAHAAGVLSLGDAVRVVYHRARLMQRATGYGKMAAVELPVDEAERAIASYAQSLSIAAVNSPSSVTLSGDPEALEALLGELNANGVMTKMMRVNYAFHSPQMEPFQDELVNALKGLKTSKPTVQIFSTVTGTEAVDGDFGAAYWARNIRQAVRFADAVSGLMAEGCTTFVEISPHPVLATSLEQCLDGNSVALPSLRRGRPERATLLVTLGALYTRGYVPDWNGLYPNKGGYVRLPDYPWQRQRYWLDVPKHKPQGAHLSGGHPLLGRRLHSPSLTDVVFETELSSEWPAFIGDHQIFDVPVLPATAYIEMVLAALRDYTGQIFALKELLIQEAMILHGTTTVQTILRQDGEGFTFEVVSLGNDNQWTRHASGLATPVVGVNDAETLEAVQSRCSQLISSDEHYWLAETHGVAFGSRFRGVQSLWGGTQEVLARVELSHEYYHEAQATYGIYPPLLDACFQVINAAFNLDNQQGDLYLPLNIGHFELLKPLEHNLWSHAVIRQLPNLQKPIFTGDIHIYSDDGQPIAVIRDFQLIRAEREAMGRALDPFNQPSNLLYETQWQSMPLAAGNPVGTDVNWLVVAGASGIGAQLAEQLRRLGYASVFEITVDHSGQPLQAYDDVVNSAGADKSWRIVYLPALDAELNDDPLAGQQLINGSLLSLVNTFHTAPELYVVTKGSQSVGVHAVTAPEQATLWGLANTLVLEYPAWRCVRIDLDPHESSLKMLLDELVSNIQDDRIAYRNGQRYVARFAIVQSVAELNGEHPLRLEIPASHVLGDLAFQPASRQAPGKGEVEIRVSATGVNFRDVLKILGMYPGPAGQLGDECAGEVVAVGEDVSHFRVGDRVVGIVTGGFDTYVTTRADLLVPIPEHMTYEDAAGIPIPFLTAYYALHHLGQLQAGKRVLIHAAAGGVGMAAVQLALLAGAEVFGTAGSPEKRAFLQSLGVQHVFNSRTLDFADEIMAVTNGEGVDMVLNSLAGEFIPKSLSLVRAGGCFLEIGKTGVWSSEQVASIKPDIAYHVIFLADLYDANPELIRTMLVDVLDGITAGQLQLLPKQLFPVSEVESAFRYMAQAKHIGKIIVTHPQNDKSIRPDGTYLITGGLGGIGLELAQWLAEQGAQNLVLMGRRSPSEQAEMVINALRSRGVRIVVSQGDVACLEDVQRALNDAAALSPIRGIFHAAGVNQDATLLNLDWSRFEAVMEAKIKGTWNLHYLTQQLPLDHFVLFSSIAANLGSVGQANYAAANAFLDAVASWRQSQGLPALSINWGAWENTGMTAVLSAADTERSRRQGLHGLTAEQAMGALKQLLSQNFAQITVMNMDWKAFTRSLRGQIISPFYANLVHEEVPVATNVKEEGSVVIRQLREAPGNQRRRMLLNHIREQAGLVMGLPTSVLSDTRQPLNTMGLDSLMAVELRNALGRSTGQTLPATLIFDYPTLDALTDHLLNDVLKLGEIAAPTPEPVASQSNGTHEVASLSDDEAEALLLEELMKPKKKG